MLYFGIYFPRENSPFSALFVHSEISFLAILVPFSQASLATPPVGSFSTMNAILVRGTHHVVLWLLLTLDSELHLLSVHSQGLARSCNESVVTLILLLPSHQVDQKGNG